MALTVISLERVPPSLRGDLSRWMLQGQAGVFVGNLNRDVQQRLWSRVCSHAEAGSCLMVSHALNEQGFEVRQHGERRHELIDLDGFAAFRVPATGPSS